MRYAVRREIFGTLRFRLTLWYTLALLLLEVVTMLAVREGLRRLALRRGIEFLREEQLSAEQLIRKSYPRWAETFADLDEKALNHPRRLMFIQLFDANGKLQWSSAHTPEVEWASILFGEPDVVAIPWDHCRVLERHLTTVPLILRVGLSTRRFEADLTHFTETMLIIGGLILLTTPVGGYLLALRATRPLAKIIDTTARLQPSNLDARLPIRGTDDELDRLSVTINGMLNRIASYLRQNREFTANAAHELRSPLAAIQNSLEVALNTDRTSEEYKELLSEVLEECGYLRVLVNQLLLLAESDAGRLPVAEGAVAFDALVRRGMEMFEGVAEAAGVDLRAKRLEPVAVRGDGNRLRQVIHNLLDNAIKFTPAGGKVTLDLRRDGARGAVLCVADSGAGINAEDLPHVFERFYRGDKARERGRQGGTGLGLSICQSIVTAHGGSIEVHSAPGAGTEVLVRLPALPSAAAEQTPSSPGPEPLQERRLM